MPFDFTAAMRELMADVAATCDEFRHVDMSRVAVGFSQARSGQLGGVSASIYPLRFAGGERVTKLPQGTFAMPRVVVGGQEMLYAVLFRLPRFLCLPFDEKLATVVHEMFHISPEFDGTLRRFDGGKAFHTGSARRFHAVMATLAAGYLERTKRPELHAVLRQSFRELSDAHGGIVGLRLRSLRPMRIG